MKQSCHAIVMVRPVHFQSNAQTSIDNKFQKKDFIDSQKLHNKVLAEFELLAIKIKSCGIDVFIVDDSVDPVKPDAIYPNNWFSTHSNGTIYLYPMMALNRRLERLNPVIPELAKKFQITNVVDLTDSENSHLFLEGTGSIVFNHKQKLAYGAISSRTNKDLFLEHSKRLNYRAITFNAYDNNGDPIYHTNVLMSVTTFFTIICLETIKDKRENELLRQHFLSHNIPLIEVNMEQMKNFCCNCLELQNSKEELFLIMSENAKQAFTHEQLQIIKKTHQIVSTELSTIESIGGGGCRCMLAEIFLPQR